MMRGLVLIAVAGALAACTQNPQASDEDLADWDPPTVQVRGDVVPRAERRFERLDRNADAALTPDEIPERVRERVMRLDTDRNGRVTQSELTEGMLRRFDARDGDRDGQVTPDERAAAGNVR